MRDMHTHQLFKRHIQIHFRRVRKRTPFFSNSLTASLKYVPVWSNNCLAVLGTTAYLTHLNNFFLLSPCKKNDLITCGGQGVSVRVRIFPLKDLDNDENHKDED